MTGWVVRQFRGPAPRIAARLRADNQAQSCVNTIYKHGTLVPLKANTPVTALAKAGMIKTVHRFGQDVAADDQYWFHWAADVDVVRGFVAGDAQERTYWTGDGVPKVTDASVALTGGTAYPMASYTLGVPFPDIAPVAVVGGTPEDATAIPEDRLYVVTLVTGWGEEGAPSDASNTVTVKVGEAVTLTLPDAPTGAHNFTAKRIYRAVAGSSTTTYLFVAEVPVATAEYVDSVLADNLGEELPSLDYEMPPADLQGLTAGPNGTLGAFKGKDVYFCEPWKPHAWPSKYILTVDADVVALAVFDTTWLVLTKERPYLISGTHPDSYAMVRSELQQACVSKRSVVSVDGGVVFASPDGLFLVGGGVVKNLTENIFTRAEWQAYQPNAVSGYLVDNIYIGFNDTLLNGFMLDLTTMEFTPLDWYASAGHYDPIRDQLFLVTGNNQLVKFNTGASLTQSWKSKQFYVPKPTCLACGRVEADGYPVTFKVWADGVLKHTEVVANDRIFRLPSGFKAKVWEFEVTGAHEIFSAGIAEAVKEMQNG